MQQLIILKCIWIKELETKYNNNNVLMSCIIVNNAGVTRLFPATSLWASSHNEPFLQMWEERHQEIKKLPQDQSVVKF